MDSWDGFGFVVFGTLFVLFLPFIVALFGRDPLWKVLSLGLCIATLLLTGFDVLMILCWLGACVFAGLAIRARRGRRILRRFDRAGGAVRSRLARRSVAD